MDRAPTVPRLPPALAVERQGAFVGRATELAELARAWGPLVSGGAPTRLLLVAGEPGVGKTRLAAEAAAAAVLGGCRVLFGRADEDVMLPFQPWAEMLRDHVHGLAPDALARWAGAAGPELGWLLPGLLPAPPSEPDAEGGRFRLFEAVVRELRALADAAPLVVVIDDLQWADRASVLLLRHVLRAGVGRLLVIATMRTTEAGDDHLRDLLAELWADSATSRLEVGGLTTADIEQLTADPVQAAAVHQLTAGNSFFVREVLQHLAEDGADDSLPGTVLDVVRRRLWRLDEQAVDLLTVAATIGREFEVGLLGEVAGVDEDATLAALELAVAARLVHEVAPVVDRFSFDHALVQQALSTELGPTKRARLHGRIAEVLERGWDGSPDALADIAWHYGEATDPRLAPKAVELARRAAADARSRFAFDEAVRQLERARHRLEAAPGRFPEPDAVRVALLLELAQALEGAGRAADAVETFTAARDRARTLGDARAYAVAMLGLSKAGPVVGAVDAERITELKEAIANLDGAERALLVRLYSALVRQLVFLRSTEDTVRVAEEGVSIARDLGDPALLSHALGALHQALLGPGDPATRLAIADETLALAEESGDIDLRRWAHAYRVIDRMHLGDLAGARADAEAVRDLGAADRPPRHEWWGHALIAAVDLAEGRLQEAEEGTNAALRLGLPSGDANVPATWTTQMFVLHWCQRRLGELAGLADAAPPDPSMQTAVGRMGVALVAAESGDRAGAQAALDEWRGRLHDLPADVIRNAAIALAALVAHRVGDAEVGAECAALLAPLGDTCITIATGTAFLGTARAYLAFGLAASGRLSDAISSLATAIDVNEAIGAVTWAEYGRGELEALIAEEAAGDRAGPR